MKRALPWIVLALMVVGTLVPGALYFTDFGGDEGYEPTAITQYTAVFDVADDGDMQVTETLVVNFPTSGRHGIFRFFDEYDPVDEHARRVPREVSVTRDGAEEEFEILREHLGRFHVVKIGSAYTTLTPGLHTYVISYTVEDVLGEGADGNDAGSQFYWNLIPGGWAQAIEKAELTLTLPEAPQGEVRCAVGVGESGGCSARVEGSSITVQAALLPPNTPVTIQADLPSVAPTSDSALLWTVRWSPVLGHLGWLLALVIVGAVGAGWLGRRVAAPSFEDTPGFGLQYAPPPGIGPGQAAYVLTERTTKESFIACLMHAAERGSISLERDPQGWTVTPLPAAADVTLDSVTWKATTSLSATIGVPFVAAHQGVHAGQVLKAAMLAVDQETRSWALREGFLTKAGLGGRASLAVIAAFALYLFLLVTQPGHMSAFAMVPGAFAALGLPTLYPGATTKRTATGRRLWSEVGGFHRVLSTPSSVDRFEFSGRRELYLTYLPWAVAFGCAAEWASKYRTEVGVEPPDPVFFGGAGLMAGSSPEAMVNDFSSTLKSAVSAYQATQSSSSSGGGGFSGGGGGGGGGGGSW